jgi:hypothetical protein
MAAPLSDIIPDGYFLCRSCLHNRHFGPCRYREATAFRGYADKPACRCGESGGTTASPKLSPMRAAEKMNVPPRRRLIRRGEKT